MEKLRFPNGQLQVRAWERTGESSVFRRVSAEEAARGKRDIASVASALPGLPPSSQSILGVVVLVGRGTRM